MNVNDLKAMFWKGRIDANAVPDEATRIVARRLLADLDEPLHDDELETLAYERMHGYEF